MLFKTIRKNITKKQYKTIMNITDRFAKDQYYVFTNDISLDYRHHFSTTYGFECSADCALLINGIPIVNKTELYIDTEVRYDIIVDTIESTTDTIHGRIKSNKQLSYIEINISDIRYITKPDLKCIYSYKNHQKIIISKIPFYTLYITNIFDYRYCILPFEKEDICDIAYPDDIIIFEGWDKYHKYNIIFKLPSEFESTTEVNNYTLSLECNTGWVSFLNGNSNSTMIFNGPDFDLKITKLKVITHGEFWKKILNESYEQLLSLKNIDSVGITKKDIFISQVQEMTGCDSGIIGPITMKKIKEYMSGLDQNKDEIPIRKRTYNNIIYENFNLISDISPAFAYAGSVVFLKSYNKFFTYDAFTESWIPIDTEVSGIYGESNNKPSIGFGIHYDAPSYTSAYNTGGYTRGINIEEEVRGYEYDEDIVPTEKEIQAANKTVNEENENDIKDILKEMNGKLNSSFNHELT